MKALFLAFLAANAFASDMDSLAPMYAGRSPVDPQTFCFVMIKKETTFFGGVNYLNFSLLTVSPEETHEIKVAGISVESFLRAADQNETFEFENFRAVGLGEGKVSVSAQASIGLLVPRRPEYSCVISLRDPAHAPDLN
jgi:hypothetical protein